MLLLCAITMCYMLLLYMLLVCYYYMLLKVPSRQGATTDANMEEVMETDIVKGAEHAEEAPSPILARVGGRVTASGESRH